jgi:spore germination protein
VESVLYIYVVRPGDSLFLIGELYGVSARGIAETNQMELTDSLVIGQALVVEAEEVQHTVGPGETLSGLARQYQISEEAIRKANPQITDPALIRAGETVVIPTPFRRLGQKQVNGYAFPSINTDTLERTLPHLTYCSVFSYQVNADGSLNSIADGPVIAAARRRNVAPMMVITNIVTGSGFSSSVAHSILTSDAAQETLLSNVLRTMREKNYYGLNIDFEYLLQEDRERYNRFLEKAAARLRAAGYILTTSLAPKTSTDQPGLLYEAHDYAAHGRIVDHVILMTYEWGYTYGPALPVAPLNLVEQVLQYAVSVIPNRKIFMGIPNYGYDWTLPFVQGTKARPLTNPGAVELARRVGARIFFDSKAQAPYFHYYSSDAKEHEVWFEDARSINAKLRLADNYGLGGVSYWTINSFFAQNWLVLDALYQVQKVL